MKLAFILFILFIPFYAIAQEEQDPQDTLFQPAVVVHEDSRIEVITKKPAPRRYTGKANGYRIQIYNGNDRNEANKIKLNFLRSFPETRAYLTYHNPQFRVRIGDFRTRRDAAEFVRLLSGRYIAMIVPEIIYVSPPKE